MIVDAFSSYSRAVHLPGKRTATVLINHILQFMLDFGFSRVIQTDGARVFTGQEFQEFLENNKIQHRLSAPMKSNSNGRVEERIKCYKNMLSKLHAEGRTTEADARSTWELLNQMPSKPGEFSPARLAFSQRTSPSTDPSHSRPRWRNRTGPQTTRRQGKGTGETKFEKRKECEKASNLQSGSKSLNTEVHLWKRKERPFFHSSRQSYLNQT